ncbi:MAG: hypothetical protein V4697_04105 [Patescibacteria group bacterium]
MLGDIFHVITLILKRDRQGLMKFAAGMIASSFVTASIILSLFSIFLFLLGFTNIFGDSYLFAKIMFVAVFIITLVSLALLFLIHKVFSRLGK